MYSITSGIRRPGRRSSSRLRILFRQVLQRARSIIRAAPPQVVRPPRIAWFYTKRALHVPTRSDRKFLIEEFGHRLTEGKVGSQCHLTVFGKDDGAGSQALAIMSALALSKKYGLTYVHTPFRVVEHAEGPAEKWVAEWERLFNLGEGEISASSCMLPRVAIEDFIADRHWWSAPCLVCARYFTVVLDRMPDAYDAVIPALRRKYYLAARSRPPSSVVDVCVHMRRGFDVRKDNPETAHRYVGNDPVATAIRQTKSVLKDLGLGCRVRVFSQGDVEEFTSLRDLGVTLCLTTPGIPTFRELVEADILIMSKSSFSYVAGLLNDGIKLYDRFARPPLSDWIVRDADGAFDANLLRRRVLAKVADGKVRRTGFSSRQAMIR
jgi:hypothetical protein